MCPPYQEGFEAALLKYYTREELDKELPGYIRSEERRNKLMKAVYMIYWLAVLSVIGLGFPNIYSIPLIGGFFRSIGMIGSMVLGTVMVGAILFLPMVLLLLSARKAKPLDSMNKEEKLQWCAKMKVLTEDISKKR